MTQLGRKPQGPALVEPLQGSEHAKRRMMFFLRTLAGECTVEEACRKLDIGSSRFFAQRSEWLQESLHLLEPGTPGRPVQPAAPLATEEVRMLRARVQELESQAAAVEAQAQIARTMPHLLQRSALKKTRRRRPYKTS